MNLTDAIFKSFAKGDHGGAPGEVVATVDPILYKAKAPLMTEAVRRALAESERPKTVEERLAELEERLAALEQQE